MGPVSLAGNLLCLIIKEGTPYEGGVFLIDIDLGADYPYRAPKVSLLALRCLIGLLDEDGNTNLSPEFLGIRRNLFDGTGRWVGAWLYVPQGCVSDSIKSQVLTIEVLLCVYLLMRYPNPLDPVNADIANELRTDPDKFAETAKQWTRSYAIEDFGSGENLEH
jgi:ubiquitin-protein ligase